MRARDFMICWVPIRFFHLNCHHLLIVSSLSVVGVIVVIVQGQEKISGPTFVFISRTNMKLHLNHVEVCTRNPESIKQLLTDQFGFQAVGFRETPKCSQTVLQSGQTVFIVTFRKLNECSGPVHSSTQFIHGEPWTNFCCHHSPGTDIQHIDSVFNIALCVEDLTIILESMSRVKYELLQKPVEIDGVRYAIVTSICGNIVHTLIEKKRSDLSDWFLPGFTRSITYDRMVDDATTHLDHVAVVCRPGESIQILEWYEQAFGMRRFLTNRNDDFTNGLVIDGDVGMRLKVMEFWKCFETGLSSKPEVEPGRNVFKLVVAESLPNIKNTQIEGFIQDHNGPGLQHIGLHTSNMVKTVERMFSNGVKFRHPPPTYYTEIGQLDVIRSVGEDVQLLSKYGILLDNEADAFDNEDSENHNERYLMQIFTYPIFEKDTFFFEVIQRKGARGFGVGNVSALARSVTAYQEQIRQLEIENAN